MERTTCCQTSRIPQTLDKGFADTTELYAGHTIILAFAGIQHYHNHIIPLLAFVKGFKQLVAPRATSSPRDP
jgi:hypothetical protein